MKLQFYKKGLPIKTIQRMLILALVFIGSVIFFEIFTNVSASVETTSMSAPTLPTVSINYLGTATTELHGYVAEMDPSYMRDAIIPLNKERNIDLTISSGDYSVDSLSYEIRSLDTQRNISSNDIDYTQQDGLISASIKAENLIDVGEEYLLVITIGSGEDEVYYYTRIMQTEGCYEKELIDFALAFHNISMSEDSSSLATFMEPKSYVSNDSLHNVSIESSLSQISYGTFDGTQIGDTYVTLTDITSNYVTLTLSYQLMRLNGHIAEYYNCSEDFRLRYTADRIYLLSYNRSMEQMLSKDTIYIEDNLVNIGITDENVQYLSNETGTIVAFVQSGSLFEYNQTERTLKTIFSFVGDQYTDSRAIYNQHQILILNIDESGTMDYVVYGYMNSGSHEGQCGINLFHYDSISNRSTEQVFISSTNSYQILNANFSDLLYETADNQFYIMVNGTLLHMLLNELTTEELMTGLDESQYAVSGSGRYMAWMDDSLISETIHILDLETGHTYDIDAPDNQLLKPLAFMEDDLIYGIVHENQILTDAAGTTVYPMYKLTISDITGSHEQELMNYEKRGVFVTNVSLDSYTINLDRITIDGDGFILDAPSDTIKNSAGEQNKAVPITTLYDDVKEKVVILNMTPLDENEKLGKIKFSNTDMVLAGTSRDVSVATTTSSTEYFVYVGNQVTLATDKLLTAITEADENMGIVLDNEQRYIWKRGRKSYQNSFQNITVGSNDNEAMGSAQALSAMLVHEGENVQVHKLLESGETPISILKRTLKNYTILDLTGLSLNQALYYVSAGSPVYAMTGEDTAVLIIGYDASTIIYYDPIAGKNARMGIAEASSFFEQYGNVFVTYIK